ncbi:MAG: DUF975 family protein [Bacillota bacterium]
MQSAYFVTMTLSPKEILSFAWRTFKARPWFFVEVSLLVVAISLLSSFAQGLLTKTFGDVAGSALSTLLSVTMDIFVGMGVVSVYLKAHDAVMSPTLRDLWNPRPFWKYLATDALRTILVFVGYVLLIVPGVIVSLMLTFTSQLVIDRGLGPIEALKESAAMTRGNRWRLFLLVLALLGLNLLGALALLLGLFVTVPMSLLAFTHAYRTLSAQTTPVVEPS